MTNLDCAGYYGAWKKRRSWRQVRIGKVLAKGFKEE